MRKYKYLLPVLCALVWSRKQNVESYGPVWDSPW